MRCLLCLLLLPFPVLAQAPLRGVVQDSVTQQPLPFASVFLAGTTLGVTTNEAGEFAFPKVPAGSFDVVGSYVGYRLSKQTVRVDKQALPPITLRLGPTGSALGEVVVKAPPHRPEDFEKFTDLFLGRSTFSQQCHITNPGDVVVFVNDSTRELIASAKNFVQVENEALGYRLKYYGLRFAFNQQDETGSFEGQPVLEEMTPRDEAQRRRWAANRATAYAGSPTHFFKSIYDKRIRQQGFLAQQVRLEAGPNSAATAKLYPAPLILDSLRRVGENGRVYLRFHHELQVAFFGEAPDPRYDQPMAPLGPAPRKPAKPWPTLRQVSRLRLLAPEVEILPNGALVDPPAVLSADYWGFEKVGEMLPLDYEPTGSGPATSATSPASAAPAPAAARLK